MAVDLAVLDEVFALDLLLKLLFANQVVVVARLDHLLRRPGRVAHLLLEDALILPQHLLHQSVLAHARGADQDERLASQGRRVERVEVLLGINEYVVLQPGQRQR